MPLLDGYEVTRRIRALERDRALSPTLIIALTATAFEENRSAILAAGCDDVLRKPFKSADLFEKMGHYLHLQYLYETEPLDAIALSAQPVDLESLAAMPSPWREALKEAATQCSDAKILTLIEAIPPDQTALSQGLRQLVDVFQFDRILVLLDQIDRAELSALEGQK